MADLNQRMRLARNPRAARIDFLIRKANANRRGGGDLRAEAWTAVSANGGGGGGGGRFDEQHIQRNLD